MSRILINTSTMLLALIATYAVKTASAQSPDGIGMVRHERVCECGRWTCPPCQQRMLCPPGAPVPGLPPVLSPNEYLSPQPSMPSEFGSQPPVPDGGQLSLDSPQFSQDATAVPPDTVTADTSDLFAANRSAAGGGGFGSSLLGATAPEMMGDFFGPGALPSIVAQSYLIDTSNAEEVGGGIIALELGDDSPPNDFFSLAPPTVNPDGSESIDLGAPSDPNDVPQPAGSGYSYLSGNATRGTNSENWVGGYGYGKPIIVPGAGYVLGRMKMAENYSPIPRDRVFFNYSLFHNVALTPNGVTVNRFTPGFEKTFLDGLASIELRTPFGSTLSSDILADGGTDLREIEFGNMFMALKLLLLQQRNWLVAGGLSVTVPTADDTSVFASDGTELLRVVNESVHVMPFLGLAYIPNRRFFAQGTVQVDMDVNGNAVLANRGNSLGAIGRLNDFTYMYTDLSMGYWIRNTPNCRNRLITGIAPIAELHFNRSMNDGDVVTDGFSVVQNPIQEFDNTNVLGGLILNIKNRSRLAIGYATPFGNGSDRVFDGEARVTFNRYF